MNNSTTNDNKKRSEILSKHMNDTQKKNQLLLDWLSESLPNHIVKLRWLLLFVATLFLLITNDGVELLEVNLPFIKVSDISSGGLMFCLFIFLLAILIDFGIHAFLYCQQFKHHKDIVDYMEAIDIYNAEPPNSERKEREKIFEEDAKYKKNVISYKMVYRVFCCKFFFNFVIYILYGTASLAMLLGFACCKLS